MKRNRIIGPTIVYKFMWKTISFVISLLFFLLSVYAQKPTFKATSVNYETIENIPYHNKSNEKLTSYMEERCRLDIYYPKKIDHLPTVIWFHGEGLIGGNKFIPDQLKNRGIAVVVVNYRLNPNVTCRAYIDDVASTVAWVFKNIVNDGGYPKLFFVSGHSAGGYLTSMIGFDKKYLTKYGVDANNIACLIPFSSHTITHITIRKEQGILGTQPTIDQYAPLYFVRPDAPSLILITGDLEL